MKEFKCKNCEVYLGEMVEGKIKRDAIVLCNSCFNKYKAIVDLENFKKSTNSPYRDFGDIFNELINKGKVK